MSKIVSRHANTDLLLSGEVDEIFPTITNGLQAFYPFDGRTHGIAPSRNLTDSSAWVLGTQGSQGIFTLNGSVSENEIITYNNPWGRPEPVWATLGNDATSDPDGGWDLNGVPVDSTKKYRFSVWVRREGALNNAGSGTTYFGVRQSTVTEYGSTAAHGNPYFFINSVSSIPQVEGNWILMVAYVYPAGYSGPLDSTAGMYDVNGNKISGISGNTGNFCWLAGVTVSGHRAYLYYSTNTTEKNFFYRPRMEICDGYESTIADLLSGNEESRKVLNTTAGAVLSTTGVSCGADTDKNLVNTGNGAWGSISSPGPWGGMVTDFSGYVQDATPFGDMQVGQFVFHNTATGGTQFATHGDYTVVGNTTYTYSAYFKNSPNMNLASSPNWLYIYEINSGGGAVNEYGLASTSRAEDMGNGWYRLWGTFTTQATTVTVRLRSFTYEEGIDKKWIKYFGTQLEQRAYLTPLILGNGATRSINGSVYFPLNVGNGNFTVFGWMRRDRPMDNTVWTNDVDIGIRTTTGAWAYLRYYLSGSVISPWIDADNWPNKTAIHRHGNAGVFFPVNEWQPFMMSRNGNELRISLRNSDKVWYHWYEYPSVNEYFDQFFLNCATCPTFKNIAVYNRFLSDAEINALVNDSSIITGAGNMYGATISEDVISKPSYAWHFPLSADGYDKYKVIAPITEQNTVYQDGCVWVGPAVSNQLSGRQTGGFFNSGHDGTNYGWGSTTNINQVVAPELQMFPNADVSKVFRLNSGVSQRFYFSPYIAVPVSTTNTLSFYYYTTRGTALGVYNNEQHCVLTGDTNKMWRNNSTSVSVKTPERKWSRIALTGTTDASGTSFTSWMNLNDGAIETMSKAEYVAFTGWQLETGKVASPFTPTSRAAGKLYIPFSKAQNTNFTVSIWVSTCGTGDQYETVDIFCDDADRWNGQIRASTSSIEFLVRTNGRAADNNLYANVPSTWDARKWNMVTLVSSAGYGTLLYVNGTQVGSWAGMYPQYNSLSIGRNGMGDFYQHGAYFRDLVLADYVFTASQISDLYRKQINTSQRTTTIAGNINEFENLA